MRSLKILLIGLFTLGFIHCDDSIEGVAIDPAFTAYISAFTSGIVSNSEVITIRFTESVNGVELNKPIEDELFDFSPDIDGQAIWVDFNTIEFRPENILPSGEYYKAEFELSEILVVSDDLETFVFDFQVIKQAVFVEFNGMHPYDDDHLEWQQVKGVVQSADVADAEILESLFSVEQKDKKRFIKWSHDASGRIHEFQIDSVQRGEDRSVIELFWDGDDLEVESGSQNFEIPSLSEFLIMNINVLQEPNQYIEINFSDPLKRNQNLEGLIYFSSQEEIRLDVHSNIVKVFPQQKLVGDHELIIEEFIENTLGYKLMEGGKQTLAFTNHKPAIEILGSGVIVPSSHGVILPFKSVNLTGVDIKIVKIFENNVAQFLQSNNLDGNNLLRRVGRMEYKGSLNLKSEGNLNYSTWNTFYLDLTEHINTEPGAIYRVSLSFRPSQSIYLCNTKLVDYTGDISLFEDPEFSKFDQPVSRYDYYRDYEWEYSDEYDWEETENPCHISYYMRGNNVVSRNILASDLGVMAKRGDNDILHAFVTDINTSDPISGVSVDLYNYQQQIIGSAKTDGDGMAEVDLNHQIPFLMIAKMDDQRGYLRLDDGTSRSVSMFNVGGKKIKNGMTGFIYGERGVWRPGDSLFLTFILEDKLNILPKGHPVVMELYTPDNKLYQKKIQTKNTNGFFDFRTKTDLLAPTGNWTAKVKIGGSEFNKRIKIEAIKPNRLKIDLSFGEDMLVKGESIAAELHTEWLHGAKASRLKADIEMSLSSSSTVFEDYPGYHFDNPAKEFSSEDKKVYDGTTDESGNSTFYPKISVSNNAPGMLNARFVTRVFEKGGEFSIDRYDIKYSPFKNYVGVKIPKGKGWNGAIYSDETTLVPIVTLDQEGNRVSLSNMTVEIYKIDWRWWWEHNDSYSLSRYVSNENSNLVMRSSFKTIDGKGTFKLNFDGLRYGRHLIIVKDKDGKHSCGEVFYVSYSGWWDDPASDNPGGAEMLSFSTNKSEYNVGEDVQIDFPPFNEGRALVSIESGAKIIDKFWVTADQSKNGISFKSTAEMSPNVFVNITLIQPHIRVSNNLPIRMYGIEKIKVVDAETVLNPEIEMLNSLEPEKKVKISISEKDGKAMTYTIAVVDDGLLDLTRFRTPDPWSEFYSLQALGVRTWDIYAYILGDYGSSNSLLAIGGDEYNPGGDGKKANRFIPVVKFMGPFHLDAGDEQEHEFIMPNYVGSVRTMVVAGENAAYGSADFTSKVKKPVMILPTLPRVIGPGEEVTIPISVFAMEEDVELVNISLKASPNIEILGPSKQSARFSEIGEEMVYFKVKAKEEIGIANFDFSAVSGVHKASYQVEMDIRPANPKLSHIYDGQLEKGQTWSKEFLPFGIKGSEKATLEISSLPSMGLEKRLKYLTHYPYGCIEQTTSAVFAQLFIDDLMELDEVKEAEIQNNINAGINKIMTFQTSSGGLSYWPGESYISEWGSNYAGHFMLEAKDQGYNVPSRFTKAWIKSQKQLANSWSRSKVTRENRYTELTQAYRLYTLAKAGSPAMGAMNRMLQMKNLTSRATWRLAGAYAIIGKSDVAEELIVGLDYNVEDYRELSYTYGSTNRDMAMILEVMVDLNSPDTRNLVMDLVEVMKDGHWLSTQESAYMMLSISKALGANIGAGKGVDASITVNGNSKSVKSNKPFQLIELPSDNSKNTAVSVKNNSSTLLFTRIMVEGIPIAGKEDASSNDLEMTTRYLDLDGNFISPERIEQGSDFVVEVDIYNPGTRKNYKELVLNQIFPSGWEIRNSRMDRSESDVRTSSSRYQDIRDDRVYSFFDLKKNERKTFRILLNASYAGHFYLPSFVCKAMYDETINANSKGRWVKVVNSTAL